MEHGRAPPPATDPGDGFNRYYTWQSDFCVEMDYDACIYGFLTSANLTALPVARPPSRRAREPAAAASSTAIRDSPDAVSAPDDATPEAAAGIGQGRGPLLLARGARAKLTFTAKSIG